MANINGWKMVRKDSGGEVLPGTAQLNFRGEEYKILGVSRPPAGSSTGRVAYHDPEWEHSGGRRDCYPSVFGLRIVPADMTAERYREVYNIPDPDTETAVPDTPAELLAESGYKMLRAELHGGTTGLEQILESFGDAPLRTLFEAATEAIVKAYALGYTEGVNGVPPAVELVGNITHVGNCGCDKHRN